MSRSTELSVNVDHVATLRQARGGVEPDPARAAVLALDAGAAGITVHLREDRRHIQDRDLEAIRALRRGELNFEMALTDEMIRIAIATRPERVTLVPERRAELTTEGGLDLRRDPQRLAQGCAQLTQAGLPLSLFLDPDPEIAPLARDTGATIVEIHTGHYANARGADSVERELQRVAQAAKAFEAAGLEVHAGHGLNTTNVGPLLQRYRFGELSIGHHIISSAIEIGMTRAVREMIDALRAV
ncbi:MAG TPA: pyridoxine 5'-phosphate synthase [Candidatus Eisenbacteria bacterium]|nr:pyridoxine 5'-phosphate synthase [Candidatus Eisenbacteria bacterium]